MTDQAFALHTIRTRVRKVDFAVNPALSKPGVLDAELASALEFLKNPAPCLGEIQYTSICNKPAAQAITYRTKLAVRKISENLRAGTAAYGDDRRSVVQSLRSVLTEAVPFNLYKLDVRQFYESFDSAFVMDRLRKVAGISNGTRRVIDVLLRHHASQGLCGLPRGLSVSSALSELMIGDLDSYIEGHPDVFFYRRYVDDLTIVTSQREDSSKFLIALSVRLSELSPGLAFKSNKHFQLSAKRFRIQDAKKANSPKFQSFDYLGYAFNVAVDKHKELHPPGREVWLDIGSKKVSRIKTRLVKSFLDFLKKPDFNLLNRRVRHLTSNMSLLDRSRGVRRLIGIHFNYPLVDYDQTVALHELDRFLQISLTSTKGRVCRKLSKALTPVQRATLGRHSFYAGAKSRHFFQLSVSALGAVQRCWKYG